MANLIQDLRYAVRMLMKEPSFTAVALAALALGIGANTAIFSMVHTVMLRPLPYPEPDRLVMVWEDYQRRDGPQREWTNPANFSDWRAQNQVFDEMFFMMGWQPTITGSGEPELLTGAQVSHGMFATLGIQPALGRAFTAQEDQPNGERVVVLGDGLWRQRFGADTAIVGRAIVLSGTPYTVIGVMPGTFGLPIIADAQLWTPAQLDPGGQRGNAFLRVIARLKKGVALPTAQAEMSTIAARLEQAYPETNAGTGIYLAGLQSDLAGPARATLLMLFGAVGFVLLIACANVANLLLARAGARRQEVAVRLALGATRGRIVRLLLTESVVLSVVGGALGVLLASWTSDWLAAVAPDGLPAAATAGLDGTVLAFTALVSLMTGIVFGVAPALDATRGLHGALKDGGRGASGGRHHLRRGLVVSEVALSLVLLAGAGLLLKSFYNLSRVDPGFDPRSALAVNLLLPQSKYETAPQTLAVYTRILEAVRAMPGVTAAGAISNLPFDGFNSDTSFIVEGRPMPLPTQVPRAWFNPVTTGYFDAMGIRLRRGRDFDERDTAQAGRVIIVNESMAREFWPGEDPIGKRIGTNFRAPNGPTWREVVGVVGNVRSFGLDRDEPSSMYFPHGQTASRRMTLVVRTAGEPLAMAATVRAAVWGFDADLAIPVVRTLEDVIAASMTSRRFTMILLAAFAALALALATIGLYGVMAYGVAQRTREIGIRLALGARPGEVLRMVLRQGLVLTAAGLAVGVVVALALGRSVSALLYGVTPSDPFTLAAVVFALAAVAALASYLPARHAMRVDPAVALRQE